MAQSPAGGRGVAAITSFDNTVTPVLLVRASYAVSDNAEQNFDYAIGRPRNWKGIKLPLWTPSFNTNETDQACNPLPDTTPDLSEKVVLIRRGTCFFDDKITNAAARGAKYFMFYNNVPGYRSLEWDTVNATAIAIFEIQNM
ncbi:hypothetical protein GGP41_003128 [Bipolaris sorokiniana]|uniref:PA domain-containing protein n=1 Tax=Cochliobolus sativus TaxID=45130 RepID=A0A8H6DRN9_COCSA|nr:hypothetical protein GGP41_003128 [Bipolaris sorokiniana]